MSFEIDVQFGLDSIPTHVPNESSIKKWAQTALKGFTQQGSLSIRVADLAEMTDLNETYRHKTGPTNVLSFPMELPEEIGESILGDIIICAPVVEREAHEQGKTTESHWAHLVIHGVLHLLGYDHINEADAQEMESLETKLMNELGYPDPYMTMENK